MSVTYECETCSVACVVDQQITDEAPFCHYCKQQMEVSDDDC